MADTSKVPKVPQVIGGRYKLTQRLGGGSFGDIYKGVVPGTSEEYAVKLEPGNAKMPQLMYECKLYKYFSGGPGIPSVKWFGFESGYNVMVMDLLGASLENLMLDKKKRSHFSLKTTIMVADQLLSRIEYFHSKDYIHRDIKPDNFLMGRDKKKNIVYVIDFGLSKRFRDANTHEHIPYREDKGMTGTVRYASVNSHLGVEQSRRDDLESIGYMLIYFLTGSLPWQGLKIDNRNQKFKAICDLKKNMPIEELCKNCPREFGVYMKYVKNLLFEAKPDYFYMRRLFRVLFLRSNFTLDFIYDWSMDSSSLAPSSPSSNIQTEEEEEEEKKKKEKDEGKSQQDTTKAIQEEADHSIAEETHETSKQQPSSSSSQLSPLPPPFYNIIVGSSLPGKSLISFSVLAGARLTDQQQNNIATLQKSMQIYHNQGRQTLKELIILQEGEFKGSQQQEQLDSNILLQIKKREEELLTLLLQVNLSLQKLTQQIKVVGGDNVLIIINSPFASDTPIPPYQLEIQQKLALVQLHLNYLKEEEGDGYKSIILTGKEREAFKQYLQEEEKKLQKELDEEFDNVVENNQVVNYKEESDDD